MTTDHRGADFVLALISAVAIARGGLQILQRRRPYLLLWPWAIQAGGNAYLGASVHFGSAGSLSLRCFSLMHDCGHSCAVSQPAG